MVLSQYGCIKKTTSNVTFLTNVAFSVANITFSVANITFSVADITFSEANVTFFSGGNYIFYCRTVFDFFVM